MAKYKNGESGKDENGLDDVFSEDYGNEENEIKASNSGYAAAMVRKENIVVRFFKYLIPWPGDRMTEIIRKLIFLASVVVLSISLINIFGNVEEIRKIEDLQEAAINSYEIPPTQEQIDVVTDEREYGAEVQAEHVRLYKDYPDYKGWISITDTGISYPLFQSDANGSLGGKNARYLRNDRNGDYLIAGEIFIDWRNMVQPSANGSPLSPNTIIYGHNMFSGHTYFTDLMNYYTLDFYKNHPAVYFDTLYDKFTWKIFAMIPTTVSTEYGEVWDYHNAITFNDGQYVYSLPDAEQAAFKATTHTEEENFNDYIKRATERSVIDTNVDVQYGDYIVTLSTCDRSLGFHDDWRFVVMARMVRPGESATVDTASATYNNDIVMPSGFYAKWGAGALPWEVR